jgi:trans-aconitate methyltransferase
MSDWDAARYHRLAEPQMAWGRAVLARLAPRAGERILDLGCGTGRLTAEIASAPGLFVAGLDPSASMLREAAARSGRTIRLVRGDGAFLPFVEAFDAVFSAATFHWIQDHDRLFATIHAVLTRRGRLVAQCGGGPNLAALLNRAHALMDSPAFGPFFGEWSDPWHFAGVADTRRRLRQAGFEAIDVSLEPAPTTLPDAGAFREFISCVCVRHHIDRLPPDVRPVFVSALAEQAASDDPPFTLDYWRLNLAARKGDA